MRKSRLNPLSVHALLFGSAAAAAFGLAASPARAADPEPMFGLFQQFRIVNADANASPNDDESMQETYATGPFSPSVNASASGDGGNSSSSFASLTSDMSETFVEGSATTSATASGSSEHPAGAAGVVAQSIFFTPAQDMIFYLRYDLDASPGDTWNISQSYLLLQSLGPTPMPISFLKVSDDTNGYEREKGGYVGVFRAGVLHQLDVQVLSGASDEGGGSVNAEFSFELRIEDADCDGLLDIWEDEGGIDITGDMSPDIPMAGADSQRKDIFVEYDKLSGVSIPSGALTDVVAAFNAAPSTLVDNPNGAAGIKLHFIDGGDSPSGSGGWTDEWGEFAAVKAANWGLSSERSHMKKDRFKEARRLTHRYMLFAKSNATGDTGLGEVPGDDCIVYQETLNNAFTGTHLRNSTAGTVMHELGHTLGLLHGGGDSVNFKPNYMSVMNYPLQMPFEGDASIWRLDYSHHHLPSLNEANLEEPQGIGALGGIYANWHTFWNAEPYLPTMPPPTPFPTHGSAQGAIDWNADFSTLSTGLRIDLNNLVELGADPSLPYSHFASAPSPDEILVGHNDWGNLRLPHLNDSFFDPGVSGYTGIAGSREVRESIDEPPLVALVSLINLVHGVVPTVCSADFNGDDFVDGADLASLLAQWGGPGSADLTGDGNVDGADLAQLLATWGACP